MPFSIEDDITGEVVKTTIAGVEYEIFEDGEGLHIQASKNTAITDSAYDGGKGWLIFQKTQM